MLFIRLIFCLLELFVCAPIAFDGEFKKWGDGSEGAYLAPPLNGNHASFLELHGSSVMLAWFSGGEGQPGCGIAFSTLGSGRSGFTPGKLVSVRPHYSNQNPVLFSNPPDLHLFHTSQATGPGGGENTSVILHLISEDDGATWSPPTLFYSAPGAFLRAGVVKSGGGFLLPAYMSVEGTDYSFMLHRPPGGGGAGSNISAGWSPFPLNMTGDLIQPTIAQLSSSTLACYFRDEDAVAIYSSSSADQGKTWTLPSRTPLPNNNAGIAVRMLTSGSLLLVYNNHAVGDLPRAPLVLSVSHDQGVTWRCARVLQIHDSNSTWVGEYSYPSIIQDDEDNILVSYTYDRETIVVRRFTETWLDLGEGC